MNEPNVNRNAQTAKCRLSKTAALCVALAALCALAACALMSARSAPAEGGGIPAAISVGAYSLSPAQYNYYYVGRYSLFLAEDMGRSSFDRDMPPDGQFYREGMTWGDYFRQIARDAIVYAYSMSDAAEKAGCALGDSEEKALALAARNLEGYAASNGQPYGEYLEELFGEGVTPEIFAAENRREALAKSYENRLISGYGITDGEIDADYMADSRLTDKVSYCVFPMMAAYRDADGDESLSAEEKRLGMREAEARARQMLDEVTDEKSFNGLCMKYADPYSLPNYQSDPEFSTFRGTGFATAERDAALSEWLFGERRAGDKAVLEGQDYWYVTYFIERARAETRTVDVMILSFRPGGEKGDGLAGLAYPAGSAQMAETAGSSQPAQTAGSAQMAETAGSSQPAQSAGAAGMAGSAQTSQPAGAAGMAGSAQTAGSAEPISSAGAAGAPLPEDPAESADAAGLAAFALGEYNAAGGGEAVFRSLSELPPVLYDEVRPGEFSTSVDAWCFSESRKPGDVELIGEPASASLIYFRGYGQPVWRLNIRDRLARDRFDAWFSRQAASFPFQIGLGYQLAQTLDP
jgi:hypothetical protein